MTTTTRAWVVFHSPYTLQECSLFKATEKVGGKMLKEDFQAVKRYHISCDWMYNCIVEQLKPFLAPKVFATLRTEMECDSMWKTLKVKLGWIRKWFEESVLVCWSVQDGWKWNT